MASNTLTCSQESADSPLLPGLAESAPSRSVSGTNVAKPSSDKRTQESHAGRTSARSIGAWPTPTKSDVTFGKNRSDKPKRDGLRLSSALSSIEGQSTFSQPGFLASQRVEPGSEEALKMTVGSGRRLSACLGKSGPLGHCLKTLMESSTWTSTEFWLKWKGRATKRNRSVYLLVPSMPRTGECESGSSPAGWPTPAARDTRSESCGPAFQEKRDAEVRGKPLTWAVKGAWKTPHGMQTEGYDRNHGTQAAEMARGPATSGCLAWTEKFVVRLMTLSAWLMGYTAVYLAHWETASSRRSRSGSLRRCSKAKG